VIKSNNISTVHSRCSHDKDVDDVCCDVTEREVGHHPVAAVLLQVVCLCQDPRSRQIIVRIALSVTITLTYYLFRLTYKFPNHSSLLRISRPHNFEAKLNVLNNCIFPPAHFQNFKRYCQTLFQIVKLPRRECEVVVREHYSLWRSRGSRCVNHVTTLVDGHLALTAVKVVVRFVAANVEKLLPAEDALGHGSAWKSLVKNRWNGEELQMKQWLRGERRTGTRTERKTVSIFKASPQFGGKGIIRVHFPQPLTNYELHINRNKLMRKNREVELLCVV
jgi:hypothetical protein